MSRRISVFGLALAAWTAACSSGSTALTPAAPSESPPPEVAEVSSSSNPTATTAPTSGSQLTVLGVSISTAKAADLRAALAKEGWDAFSIAEATPDSMYARCSAIACKGKGCGGADKPTISISIDRGAGEKGNPNAIPLRDVFEMNQASSPDYPQIYDEAADVLVHLKPAEGMSNAEAKALLERIVRRPQ